jgi:hypothetical protein
MVPVDGRRVKEAIDRRGHNVNAVARLLRDQLSGRPREQATLNNIVNGKVKRCRRSRRDRLGRLLGVPSEWLAGAAQLPDVPEFDVHRMPNAMKQQDGTWTDVYYMKVPGESGVRLSFTGLPTLPPRVQLEVRDAIQLLRFFFDPDGASFPDFWIGPRRAKVSPDYRSREARSLQELEALPSDVVGLFSLDRWRALVFGTQQRNWHPTPEESDEFAKAIGRAIRLIFEPSMRGAASFDVPARRQILEAQRWARRRLGLG